VPAGHWFEYVNESPAEALILFVASDEPTLRKLALYRKWGRSTSGEVMQISIDDQPSAPVQRRIVRVPFIERARTRPCSGLIMEGMLRRDAELEALALRLLQHADSRLLQGHRDVQADLRAAAEAAEDYVASLRGGLNPRQTVDVRRRPDQDH